MILVYRLNRFRISLLLFSTVTFCLMCLPATAQQTNAPKDLIGTWFNQDPETMGMTQVVIANQEGTLVIHGWGACVPRDCDQGAAEVTFEKNFATATFDVGFARDLLYLTRLPNNKLLVIDKLESRENSKYNLPEQMNLFVLKEESQTPESVAARAILAKVAAAYKQLTNAELESEGIREGQGKVSKWHVKATFGDGGRFRTETESSGESRVTITDGKTHWTLFPESKQYTSFPTGTDSQLDAYRAIDTFSGTASVTGSEDIDGREATVVRVERPNQIRTLWIDPPSNFVRQERTVSRSTKPDVRNWSETTRYTVIRPLATVNADLFSFDPEREHYKLRTQLQAEASTTNVGMKAPEFTFANLDGKFVRLSELRGKTVLLDFWATWCTPCRAEMPIIELLHRQFKDKGLVVLGIDDEDALTQKAYLQQSGFSFASLVETKKELTNQLHVGGIPTTVLIDQQGIIRYLDMGEAPFESLRENLQKVGLD
jgi:peroxiredoxin/outer membrane lipoprotein-sorting protein